MHFDPWKQMEANPKFYAVVVKTARPLMHVLQTGICCVQGVCLRAVDIFCLTLARS